MAQMSQEKALQVIGREYHMVRCWGPDGEVQLPDYQVDPFHQLKLYPVPPTPAEIDEAKTVLKQEYPAILAVKGEIVSGCVQPAEYWMWLDTAINPDDYLVEVHELPLPSLKFFHDGPAPTGVPAWMEEVLQIKMWDPGQGEVVGGSVVIITEYGG